MPCKPGCIEIRKMPFYMRFYLYRPRQPLTQGRDFY